MMNDLLTDEQMSSIKGGGVWIYRDEQWIYVDDRSISNPKEED